MEEIFTPAKYLKANGELIDFTGLYEVSNIGRLKRLNYRKTKGKEVIMDYSDRNTKYINIPLYKDKKEYRCQLHRLVLSSFKPETDTYEDVNHIDENKHNNRLDNLEWCTKTYNQSYGTAPERKRMSQPTRKEILQYDLDGNLIKKWNSVKEIRKTIGYVEHCIIDCCKGRAAASYNYVWKYA